MPYNVDKKSGGDSPSNTKWMEKCVNRTMSRANPRTKKNYTKSEAIAICKTIFKKKK